MPTAPAGIRSLDLADEAQRRFDLDAAIAHLSAAVRAFTVAGEQRAAAMACLRLGDVMANFLGNLTAGRTWYARARRLVADEAPCIEQGWVAVAGMGCDAGDPEDLLARSELALDLARRFGDLDLETKALADGGLALVQAGRLDDGFAWLDEAMALACGPADGDAASRSACSLFTACYYSASFDRAEHWADLLRRHGLIGIDAGGPVFLHSHCSSLQGAFLLEQGRWDEAEQVLVAAGDRFEAAMGASAFHTAAVLADLRVRQGRLTEAEALLAGQEQAFEMLLPCARLELARGDASLAAAVARRGLRALGADRLRAIELLEVLVAAELRRGDLPAARVALDELRERNHGLAEVGALALRLACASASVMASSGDLDGAIVELERALATTPAARAPWRSAVVRLELARLRLELGEASAAATDARAAAAILSGLDVVVAPEHLEVLRAGGGSSPAPRVAAAPATLSRTGRTWTACHQGVGVQLHDSKGLRHLAELISRPGVEQHALDLVDRVEGVDPDGATDRRRLGDAGPTSDAEARRAYRRRAEQLRAAIDDAFAAERHDRAEALQDELDRLVAELSASFGLGGRSRTAGSAAERARVNVTRSIRSAINRLGEALPLAGADLDRSIRTGTFCRYEPADGAIEWIVPSRVNERTAD